MLSCSSVAPPQNLFSSVAPRTNGPSIDHNKIYTKPSRAHPHDAMVEAATGAREIIHAGVWVRQEYGQVWYQAGRRKGLTSQCLARRVGE